MTVDAGTALLRALERSAPPFALEGIDSHRWASVTFAGERHRLRFTADDDAALSCWLASVPDAELTARGHLVADLAVLSIERQDGRALVTLEALTLEDA